MKYVVEYELPYVHSVQIGIEADSEDTALATAEQLFDDATIWDDTPDFPLLRDDFDETGDGPLVFTIAQVFPSDSAWPEPDYSVRYLRRQSAAMRAARQLVEAYGQADPGSIDRHTLDGIYQIALLAITT